MREFEIEVEDDVYDVLPQGDINVCPRVGTVLPIPGTAVFGECAVCKAIIYKSKAVPEMDTVCLECVMRLAPEYGEQVREAWGLDE
jgi:hypothetical protein